MLIANRFISSKNIHANVKFGKEEEIYSPDLKGLIFEIWEFHVDQYVHPCA